MRGTVASGKDFWRRASRSKLDAVKTEGAVWCFAVRIGGVCIKNSGSVYDWVVTNEVGIEWPLVYAYRVWLAKFGEVSKLD